MNYYKAEATFTVDGKTFTLTDIKASDRNYSHAVVTAATIQNEFYLGGERNPFFGEIATTLTFHQGLDNAQKATKSHATLGGLASLDKRNNIKREINPTAQTIVVQTTLVDGKTYREFKKNFISTDFQAKVGG